MFATMRRKNRSARMKSELGQSVDHFKRAAVIAAHETSATVGPKIHAARDRVQPTATKAKDAASSSWDSAVATLTPLVAAATENAAKVSKRTVKANKKTARKLERRTNRVLGRKRRRRTGIKLGGLLLAGAAVGAAGAYVVRKRRREQWDEYEPSGPIGAQAGGADDAAFEPADGTTTLVADEETSAHDSPTVARMAGGQNPKN